MGKTIILLFTLLLMITQTITATTVQPVHNVKFYVLGSMGCPACSHLKEVLTQAYGEDSMVFMEVSQHENGEKLMVLYSIIYPEVREYPIPLTIIVVDGELAGSAIGAMEADFWQYMINESLKTGKFMVADGEGKIYVADKDPGVMVKIAEIIGLNASQPSAPAPANHNTTRAENYTTMPKTTRLTPVQSFQDIEQRRSIATTNYITLILAIILLVTMMAFNLRKTRSKIKPPKAEEGMASPMSGWVGS